MAGTNVATSSWAAGQNVKIITFAITADASDGSVPDATSDPIDGYVMRVMTKPGTTNPQAAYDLTLKDSDGAPISGTNLNDRSASNPENWICDVPIYVAGPLTLSLANNNVNSAGLTVKVYVQK